MSSRKKNKKSSKKTKTQKRIDVDSSQLPNEEQEAIAASESSSKEIIDELNADQGYLISFFSGS